MKTNPKCFGKATEKLNQVLIFVGNVLTEENRKVRSAAMRNVLIAI